MNIEQRKAAEGITETTKPEVRDQVAELYTMWLDGKITAAQLANKAYLAGYLKRSMETIADPQGDGSVPTGGEL